jgi:hypothetical protein
VVYTATRLLLPLTGFVLWVWLRDGTVSDPANLLLVVSIVTGGLALAAVRRYWLIRKTSRSRRDSSLLS